MAEGETKRPLFALGRTLATPGAIAACDPQKLRDLLGRHVVGDWGDICEEDRGVNEQALADGDRIFSVYKLGPEAPVEKVWIITEHDRSLTTVLLPDEY